MIRRVLADTRNDSERFWWRWSWEGERHVSVGRGKPLITCRLTIIVRSMPCVDAFLANTDSFF
jgi:hypothetical protein